MHQKQAIDSHLSNDNRISRVYTHCIYVIFIIIIMIITRCIVENKRTDGGMKEYRY